MKLFYIFYITLFVQNTFSQQSELSRTVNDISSFIASEYFVNLRKEIGDVSAADSIFINAVMFTNGNISDALLALMLATVPYREVPIRIPLINTTLDYPLTSAGEETFLKKNENLPRYFFFDTPQNNFGDQDKLAHFFGSAFLSYESHLFDMGKLIGYFVEAFEESFKVQSSVDIRDLDVNDYGRLFGNLLQENKDILPSQIFLIRSIRFLRVTI
ncbi:MAG: hypothetical protein MUF28_15005 [Ignavibacterium sp.]|jgi:hypothetical protein|nr:hypothetical protein [Ignavibacterium sp.]